MSEEIKSDDINFLPEKDKDQKEKKKVKAQFGDIEFHTPTAEPGKQKTDTSTVPTFQKLFGWLVSRLAKLKFVFRRQANGQKFEELVKQPAQPRTTSSTFKIKLKPASPAQTTKPAPMAPLPAAKPLASRPREDFDLSGDLGDVDVNLMPWQDPSLLRRQRLGVGMVITSLAIIIAWGTVLRITNNSKEANIDSLENSISLIDAQLANINVELLSQGSQVAVRQSELLALYNSLPTWSRFFAWLESRTDQEVYFRSLGLASGNVVFDVAAPNYQAAARQWLAFKNATSWVADVQVGRLIKTQSEDPEVPEEVEFELVVELNEETLSRSSQPVNYE